MQRVTTLCLTLLLLAVPTAMGAAATTDATPATDTVLAGPGQAVRAEVDLTGDQPELTATAVPAADAFPTSNHDAAERPNCLHGGDGWAPVGLSALGVAGDDFAPLVEAGAAEECAPASFAEGFDSVTFVTQAEGESRALATWSMGFVFNTFTVSCDGTGAGVGPTEDVNSVSCEAQTNGVHTSSWAGWDADIHREDASGASYVTFGSP